MTALGSRAQATGKPDQARRQRPHLRPVAGEVFAVGPDLVYRWLERVNPTLSSATSSSLEVQPVGPMPLHPTQDNGFTLQPPILSTLLLRHRRSGSVQQ